MNIVAGFCYSHVASSIVSPLTELVLLCAD